ncbi:hypothetical protein D4764_17G0008000 [Takifugu flavidus]|uniref:Uncharacterized protein n=1 Tax=Takifugu flavidus TaxID=433684 RepID=A0A5C6NZT9_9TELE|nr:hypothetical protein D4764_17G0008000 [Takifugu flavidus]
MAEFGNGLAEESLLDSDPGHPELEDPGVGDEEPGLEEGEAAIEDPLRFCLFCTEYHLAAQACMLDIKVELAAGCSPSLSGRETAACSAGAGGCGI